MKATDFIKEIDADDQDAIDSLKKALDPADDDEASHDGATAASAAAATAAAAARKRRWSGIQEEGC